MRSGDGVLALHLDRALEARPRAHRRLAQLELAARAEDLAQILDGLPARRAAAEVLVDAVPLDRAERSVDVVVQGCVVRLHLFPAQKRAQLQPRLEHL